MTRSSLCGLAIIAATGLAWCLQDSSAHGQGLFNNRPAGQTGNSAASASSSLFSRNTGFPPTAMAGMVPAAGGSFVGRSNQGFVGRSAAGGSSAESEEGSSSRRAEPQRRAGPAASGSTATPAAANRLGETGGGRRTRIVPRHRIAFEFVARQPPAIGAQLQAQLANLAARNPDFANIEVQVDAAGQVHLHGGVPTESTRKLAAILVRLEPGVRAVHNELTVESAAD